MSEAPKIEEEDAVFGEITEEGPNYRNVGFLGTVILMMKTQIGLGLLSVPGAFDVLGIVPGIICLCAISCITTWSAYIIGTFKLHHREVYGIDDAGHLICGQVGRGVLSIAFCLFIIVTIAVGVQDRPATAPQTDTPWVPDYKIIGKPTFTSAISAVSTLLFAFSGTPGFFAIVSEMRNPRQYTRAVLICQVFVTVLFAVVGCVVYYYCGSYVASPALGSAGGTMKKVCYGLALPGLIVTMTIVAHIPAKYIFIHILRGSHHLTSNTPIHWMAWLGCTFGVVVIAYIIASAIPVFDGLVSLIGALLVPLMCFQPYGAMWLYDNWGQRRDTPKRWYFMVCWSVFVIVIGTFLMVAGTYGSVVGIIDTYKTSGGSSAFSCADNSNSV
ncbi:uncharacterized protein ACHE_30046A [Aspergillus chevalieri]|uniref:Amino acid transporter transmembrane domain-containing protein n=1 Tax=Aspergillus chevalieri TaxID=182096 RepID=A0A7R7ZLW6_ASPCH|nr:uncharacterized protein ACHE_30046A [Aspergillus chevalieri]BCR86059.1 hypothetical protein ACHE_30046A [Aspergillus chevalieri]